MKRRLDTTAPGSKGDFTMTTGEDGLYRDEMVIVGLLADVRDELRKLNRVFACPNFQQVPQVLRQIRRNTAKKRKPRAVGKPKLRVVR